MALMNVCAVRSCVCCVLTVGWVVGFRWAVDTCLRIGVPEADGGAYVAPPFRVL